MTKILKSLLIGMKVPRCSTLVAFLLYIVFILFILTISFPMKSNVVVNNKRVIDDNDNQIKPNGDKDLTKLGHNKQFFDKYAIAKTERNSNVQPLIHAFIRADLNKDSMLTLQELARFINRRIRDHIDGSIKTNPISFAEIDVAPRDGLVSWQEYHEHFLRKKGMSVEDIGSHNEKKHTELDRKAKEEMMRDKALWNDAARTDSFTLTLDEFLSFRHPESSAVNLLGLVDDLLRQFDDNGDDYLTMDEFSQLSVDDVDEKLEKYVITKTVHDREQEFRRIIDLNKDGKADRSELLSYIDPRHPRHALQEAVVLFDIADEDKDERLSLEEVISQKNLFFGSKMMGTAESFHDEF